MIEQINERDGKEIWKKWDKGIMGIDKWKNVNKGNALTCRRWRKDWGKKLWLGKVIRDKDGNKIKM
jgi:hypothetical protein